LDPGWVKIRIRDKHPGSATLFSRVSCVDFGFDLKRFLHVYLMFYFYSSDQYPGHPDAVNSMVAATDNVLITACEDGIIRAVHLFPHRFIGQVGLEVYKEMSILADLHRGLLGDVVSLS
jgi:hypothetical protein